MVGIYRYWVWVCTHTAYGYELYPVWAWGLIGYGYDNRFHASTETITITMPALAGWRYCLITVCIYRPIRA